MEVRFHVGVQARKAELPVSASGLDAGELEIDQLLLCTQPEQWERVLEQNPDGLVHRSLFALEPSAR